MLPPPVDTREQPPPDDAQRRRSGTLVATVVVVVAAGVLSFGTFLLTRGGADRDDADAARGGVPRTTTVASVTTARRPVQITASPTSLAVAATSPPPQPTTATTAAEVAATTVCASGLVPTVSPCGGEDDGDQVCGNGFVRALPCESTPQPTLDPPADADLELLQLAAADSAFVDANMSGTYVVQVNAKYLGRTDELDGRFYDAQAIIDLYHDLNSRYGAVAIVVADDYSTKSYPGLFQMLLKQSFSSQEAGQAWCDQMGLTINDCFPRGTPLGRR
jgi:hypothetical protein